MQKFETPLTFVCPVCKGSFQFDQVEEYQLVPCPICGVDFITVRRDQKIVLEYTELENVLTETFR